MRHHDSTVDNDLTGAIPELPASVLSCEFGEEGLCDVTEAFDKGCFVSSEHTVDDFCACFEWPCDDDTTRIWFEDSLSGTIPTEIGLLNSVTSIDICTCFGGCSIVFGSPITCLTTHVWLNCASPRHDR